MKPDTTVQLGDFTFKNQEVPERIPFGGDQQHHVHTLIGGQKVVDAMGSTEGPINWSGIFRGADALTRSRQLDRMRKDGLPLVLTWFEFSYRVLITRFTGHTDKAYEIPYTIDLEVIEDLATPAAPNQGPGIDDMMASDMAAAEDLGTSVGDPTLTGLLGDLADSVGPVKRFASATRDTINGILGPLNAAAARVDDLIGQYDAVVENAASVGLVAPFIPAPTMAGTLAAHRDAFTILPTLYDTQNILGRMETNLGAVLASGTNVVVAGSDLYHLAAQAYGTAAGWSTIARANGMTDPVLAGIQTILIPPQIDDTDGVLTA